MSQEETAEAVHWVNANPKAAARKIADMIDIPESAALLFFQRPHLAYQPSTEVAEYITHYLDVLNKSGYGSKTFGELRALFHLKC